ncbi:MAG: NAD(P)-binding domain-containing protein [Phaeodactylibacter sp.]|nr:NAD(P)-binding domain-containing protein [Phaeodactylibacter sp.]MCB9049760.1 NAD(P)-binding domain-containing protein [Lewinellaceae bacterium]
MPNPRKVLLIDPAHPYLVEHLVQLGYEVDDHHDTPLDELQPLLGGYFGMVIRSRFTLDEAFLDRCTSLKFIARMGIGLEHIDVQYAKGRGILVLNSPEGSRDTVAEHTMGFILSLLNHINRSNLQVRKGQWIREGNKSYELRHRTVGIIGYGNIGSAVAQRLNSFGCRVIAYDKFKTNFGGVLAEEVSLETVFREADIVTLHIPYEDYNHYFVNRRFLGSFRKPVFLVNTSRGLVLETDALVESLQSGKVLGAALDVIEYEEQSFNKLELENLPEPFQYLRRADNVIITPHIAGLSHEVMGAHARVLIEKIEAAFP